MRRPFDSRRASGTESELERLRSQLSPFGSAADSSEIKQTIATLRELRDAGSIGEAEYATRLSTLLGAVDPAALTGHQGGRAPRTV
jgi:hypothetical protein